ncbi:alpha-ketoglutarate-dependent dioxygenase alkB homolog 6 [Anthonomus grandis grandis]|uniref:alpha-ketoglutarate-dependent dioxygenase alkB homolog 6 n=1 Tax=Anthonomus grandis grandis TaxID=2921223 RepID=UPI0021653D61|nr:alpha-ketoglutarate-dependent dioxygenase alkB homolog 6 [Anthonomus grandis grandis]XP_050297040.1 alpha-ketoglutarate-dependent dioxygenase alkB homolog 6 [Anthonomus grandis grandis]
MDVSNFRVPNIPPTIYYIPNFITQEEEEYIIKNVYSVPKPKWTCLTNRRLQDYGGVPHEKGMIPEKIPSWLQQYVDKVSHLNIFEGRKPNHVLVNEYLPGQGIMPHTDGPLFYPTVTTISCGSHTILEFLENNEKREKICDILLERCSLVIVKDDMYKNYLHSIREVEIDSVGGCANLDNCMSKYPINEKLKRETRISLTIRNVPKVLKIKLF